MGNKTNLVMLQTLVSPFFPQGISLKISQRQNHMNMFPPLPQSNTDLILNEAFPADTVCTVWSQEVVPLPQKGRTGQQDGVPVPNVCCLVLCLNS